jgi:uncharacterized protein (DUF885 family)
MARREAMAEANKTTPVVKPAEPVTPPATKAEIDMTPEELAAATALSKSEREARAKVKELEAKAPDADKLAEARTLVASGKHLAAAELLGIDLNAAVAEQLAVTPADGEEPDPKVKELEETVKKLTQSEAERAKRDAEQMRERVAAARVKDVDTVVEHVKAATDKYPYLARNPDGASDAYPKVKERLGRDLTGEEKHQLMEASLAEAEAQHASKAKLYGATGVDLERNNGAPTPRPSARPSTFDASMRGGTATPVTRPKTKLTFSEVKRARRTAN